MHEVNAIDRGVSTAFAQLGLMYEFTVPGAHGNPDRRLSLSGVAPQRMNQRAAVAYCDSLGGGARLPTQDEFPSIWQKAYSHLTGSAQKNDFAV